MRYSQIIKSSQRGLVFDIQRYSIHDGPGIRTTVFLKGCNLRCQWCQNPEGMNASPELQFFPEKCIACNQCFRVCPTAAHQLRRGQHIICRDVCTLCGKCVEECYAGALILSAVEMSVDEVMEEVLKDRLYYEVSGGGVTFSGGDPLVQCDFFSELLIKCKSYGLHTAIETAGYISLFGQDNILSHIDLIMLDIKMINTQKHKEYTGVDNQLILEQCRILAESGKLLIIRTPVIPGVNDTVDELQQVADFIKSLIKIEYWEILPYHRLGESKYRALGLTVKSFSEEVMMKRNTLRGLASKLQCDGIRIKV